MSFVTKRDGRKENVKFDKITERINKLINPIELQSLNLEHLELHKEVDLLDPVLVAQKVVTNLYSGITTEELDKQSAEICVNLSTTNPLYSYLGGRILISNLHKKTLNSFSEKMKLIVNESTNINPKWVEYVLENKEELDKIVQYNRDYLFDYFGFKTLEKAYLLKVKKNIIERPQDMFLRTAITLQMGNLELIKKTYDYMSLGYYTHASPTLFNSGTNFMQLSSCFLENTEVMTMKGIKNIQDVELNDEVVTHTGSVKKVLQLHKNPLNNRKIFKLQVHKTKSIFVTDNHRFMSISKENSKPTWRRIDELTTDNYLVIPAYEGEMKNETINNITVDEEYAKLFGMFYMDGMVTNSGIKFNNNTMLVKKLMNNKFSLKSENDEYKSNEIRELFSHMFMNSNKKQLWKNMFKWEKKLIQKFGEGISSVSKNKITNELYHLFRLFGIDVKLNDTLTITNIYSDVRYLKINELKETDEKPEYVYTIGIEDDHSYNVEGLICENCFLLGTSDDLNDIGKTWSACAQISKWAGGIGLHTSNIRGKDSLIKGTGGVSNGLVPFLKVFNNIARWIDQGGKRPGSIAIYLEPHHPDIYDFLELRKNFGSENERARDLFLALWISDLFMKQVEVDGDWYLLSSDDCPRLTDCYGDEYETLYWKYVNEKKYRAVTKARKLWMAILDSQIETGMPYIGYKDHVNRKSNQKNVGIIRSSNLCIEITEYSDHNEYAVCNLASIALKTHIKPFKIQDEIIVYSIPNCKFCVYAKNYLNSMGISYKEMKFSNETLNELKTLLNSTEITFPQIFIKKEDKLKSIGGFVELYRYTASTFDFDKLYETAYTATVNLNNVIDINYYPVPETKLSNMRHRPIGLGIQGIADILVLLRIPFESEEAVKLNGKIMETIYLAAVTASNDISKMRLEGMRTLIKSEIKFPEYYEDNFNTDNEEINKLYHNLKPCKFELSKNPESTTLGAYSTFDGSPFSEGKLQFDHWDNVNLEYKDTWDELKKKVIKYGTRNSLLTALMPTASTSQILNNNECFEFFTNNIYTRKTQAGDFVLVNKYLVKDLIGLGIWNPELKDKIIANNGSIQSFANVPTEIKNLYKTMWEIKQVWVIKAAVARGAFVDQSQSMNIFMAEPNYQRLSSSHFYGWKNGLKTGMYYLRTKPSADAIKFTIDPNLTKEVNKEKDDTCYSCSA